jgi:integrase
MKRGNGEGSIYKRASDGRYCGVLSLGYDGRGKPVRKAFYGKTKKEVREKLDQAQQLYDAGVQIAGPRQTVGSFLMVWLDNVMKPRVRYNTYLIYSSFIRMHLIPAIGRHQLDKLQPQHIQQLLNAMLDSGLAPGTVRYANRVLKTALFQAVRWGLLARNVATLVDPPGDHVEERPVLSPEQARTFLQTAAGQPNAIMYSLALYLGLRRGEVRGLRWQDIDWKQSRLHVRKNLIRIVDRVPVLDELKTKGSRRTIPLPPLFLAALRSHQARQADERLKAGGEWHNYDLVICDELGFPVPDGTFVYRFKRNLRQAGLPNIHFHDLRHSCATLLAAEGVPPRVIMEILGHSNLGVTTLVYTHAVDDGKRSAVDALEQLLEAG